MMTQSPEPDFEHLPAGVPMDETDVSLRAYLARLSDDRLARYDPTCWKNICDTAG